MQYSSRRFVLGLALLSASITWCQQPVLRDPIAVPAGTAFPGCATDEMRHRQPPRIAQRTQAIDRSVRSWIEARGGAQREELTIPVAVHIIHGNGDENIADALVLQGIQDLNDAFANAGSYHEPDGVDVGIRFCLAQQDPNGAPSNGITRTLAGGGLTDMVMEDDDITIKDLDRWDPERYLNIWLVREITSQSMGSGVAGYAYFPSSHGGPEDGIMNEARWFGSSTDNSKVHIHEVGHYLGLYHTFEGGCTNNDCLADGDHVCDTPPDGSSAAVPCAAPVNTCTTDDDDASVNNPFRPIAQGGQGDQPDSFQDYMDYGLQSCQHLFTTGQADRMNAMLTTARASLLTSDVCENPCPGLLSASFMAPIEAEVGVLAMFLNASTAAVEVGYTWYINGDEAATTEDFDHTFTTAGTYTVTLRVTNTAEGCFDEMDATVTVICNADAQFEMEPPTPVVGQSVLFTSTGAGSAVQWYVDDVLVGSGTQFNAGSFSESGGHSVRMIAQGSGCADTSVYAFLPVGPCMTGANNVMLASTGNILSFNNSEPDISVTPGFGIGGEGMSCISDANGNLILYTDGQTVFNGAHQIIGTGLLGGGSSTQAALIVPKPGSNTVFYIFTTDDWVGTSGGWMTYSEVDLSLNGGAGDMVLINEVLMANTSEKLAAVRSCNQDDIWVIGVERTSGTFHAFSVTAGGVNTTAVTSAPGFAHGPSLGAMKGSPKGNKLAAAFRDGNPYDVMLFDFNNEFGIVTNPVPLGPTPQLQQYGVEFSADGSKLYVSNADDALATRNTITQYDLLSGIPETMRASRMVIGTSHCPWSIGSLQRAPNGRIYVTLGQASALGEIRHPDQVGTACEYVDFAVPLLRPVYGFGLTNVVPSRAEQATPLLTGPRQLCSGFGHADYTLSCTGFEVTVQHQGPNESLDFTGNVLTLDIQETGVDTLIMQYANDCGDSNRDTVFINVGAPPIDLGPDVQMCSTGHVFLDAGAEGVAWAWQNSTGQLFGNERLLDVTAPGTYIATITSSGGCTSTDEVTVTTFPSTFQFSLGPDVSVCPGPSTPVTVHAPPVDALAYEWNSGSTAESITVNSFWSVIWLTITDPDGCRWRDTLRVVQVDPSTFTIDLGPDLSACPGQVWVLDAGACNSCSYLWQDGFAERHYTAYTAGTYSVEVSMPCDAHAVDEVTISPAAGPGVDLGDDQDLCPFAPFTLDAAIPGLTYIWEDGSTGQTHAVGIPGLYAVTATNNEGCSTTDSLIVSACTGVGGTSGDHGLSVRPNPANDRFRITLAGSMAERIELLDAVGRMVLSAPMVQDASGAHADVGTTSLANGAYVVRLRGGDRDISVRVVIAH